MQTTVKNLRVLSTTLTNLPFHYAVSTKIVLNPSKTCTRFYSSSKDMKVTVIGASGKTGRPLSLMLKQSPLIDELCVYDIKPTCGFAMELGHVDTKCKVSSYTGKDSISHALQNSKVVVVVAAAPNSETASYDSMFESNAKIVQTVAEAFAKHSPKAVLAIASSPINSLVPLAYETLKKISCVNSNSILGITSLDVVRANTLVAETQGLEPECVAVPVIGGNFGKTIVPVLSQSKPCAEFTNEELGNLTKALQTAHADLLVSESNESAPLSSAFAIARFVISVVKGLRGFPNVVECAYVRSQLHPKTKYLSTPVQLGPFGVIKNLGIPHLTDYEDCLLETAAYTLRDHVKLGEAFIKDEEPSCDPCDPNPNAPRCPPDWCEKMEERAREERECK